VELDFRTRLTNVVQFSGDWTFQDAKYQRFINPATGDTLDGLRVYNTARYIGTAALDLVSPRGDWLFRVSTNVVGPYSPFDEPGVILDPYALLHFSGTVHLRNATLEFGIRNALDKAYPELVAGGAVSPGQPRTFYGGIRYSMR